MMWKARMAGSGTDKCLGWLYPVLLLLWAAQTSALLIVLHFKHWGASTAPPGWFLGFTSALPQFRSVTFSRHSFPRHPPNENIPDTTSYVQPTNFFLKVIWQELLWAATSAREALKHSEMVYLLGKFHSRAHNPWLVVVHWSLYLVTSNVRFGSVSINPVTYSMAEFVWKTFLKYTKKSNNLRVYSNKSLLFCKLVCSLKEGFINRLISQISFSAIKLVGVVRNGRYL